MKTFYGNNHSFFSLHYQLILVVKDRKNLFTEEIVEFLIKSFNKNSASYRIEYISSSYEKDHIHIDFKAHPISEISKFINSYKSSTSRLVKKLFPYILDELEDNSFWESTYFLITKEGLGTDIIKEFMNMKIHCLNHKK